MLAQAEPLRYARSDEPSRKYLPVQAVYAENPQNASAKSDVESSSEKVQTVQGIPSISKSSVEDICIEYLQPPDGSHAAANTQCKYGNSIYFICSYLLSKLTFEDITGNMPQQRPEYETPKPASTCETPGCVAAASKVMSYIDESLDPCENFYDFACGTYLRNTQVPEDKVTVDAFSNVRDLVQEQLRIILNEPPQSGDSKPFLLAKNFHSSCLNQENIEARGIKPLADILEAFGGWPVLKGDLWSEGSFDWIETIKKFRRMGFDTYIIFAFSSETDLKNSSQRNLVVSN